MCISQRPGAVPDLIALATDSDAGRRLCDRGEVDGRTRAFALHGLGLVASAHTSRATKRLILDTLRRVLADDSITATEDVHVAALDAIGLLRPAPGSAAGDTLRRQALAVLDEFYDRDLSFGRQLVQAHVAPSASALLAGTEAGSLREAWIERLVREVQQDRRSNPLLAQSAALALGNLARPHEDESPDAWVSEALIEAVAEGRDLQTGQFALIALGQIGGSRNVDFLLQVVATDPPTQQRTSQPRPQPEVAASSLRDEQGSLDRNFADPWAALALGVHEHRRIRSTTTATADERVVDALAEAIDAEKRPGAVGAFAIGLGLCRAQHHAERLRDLLDDYRDQDEVAGYLCIGLALMDDRGAIEPILEIATDPEVRPQLLLRAATALGSLGDELAAGLLTERMAAAGQDIAVTSALSSAVGHLRDRRTIAPLIGLLEDEDASDLLRASAAVALGGVADKEIEPWNAKIGRLVNYRAAVATLSDQTSGILDIR